MSLLSSVTGAAATIAAGLDPVAIATNRPVSVLAGVLGGLAGARTSDPLTAKLTAGIAPKAAAKATTAKASTAKASTAKATATKASTTKASTTRASTSTVSKSTTATKTTASTGYSKVATDDFAFLKDKTLSVEEKLFKFMCAVAKRNDDEVLKKMEEMKGGAAASASGSGSTSAAKKSKGTSIWGALKALVPPLGLAAQVIGDAKLKSLISKVTGPVLAAAATALGMPALAPVLLKAAPGVATAVMNGTLGGDDGGTATGSSSSGSSSSSSAASSGKNEQVQMMELQRLVDKQKEMFSMISNVLRAQHDTRMAIIGNVR